MKPIIIFLIPLQDDSEGIKNTFKSLEKKLNDYYVIMVEESERKLIDVKVFSDKNIKPIELKKLKEMVKIK